MTMIRVGITVGDINGIGPEIVIKALGDKRITELCTPVIYGNTKLLSFYKKGIKDLEFHFNAIKDASQIPDGKINVINCWQEDVKFDPGNARGAMGGKYAFSSLDAAVSDVMAGRIDVLVTAPVDKSNIQKEALNTFTGHTEYLGQRAGAEPIMLMVHNNLRVALVTGHISLQDVSRQLTREKVSAKLEQISRHLFSDFGIKKPKIAVLGLNPHNGDEGLFGKEEQEIIIPAIEQMKSKGLPVMGPFPADGFFASGAYNRFDAVVAMYHDQGLVPFKLIAGMEGINYTMGLPFVRTSPDHGTAFDIAGQGKADESGLRNAIYAAIDIHRKRKQHKDVSGNPLPLLSPEELNKLK
ncbi:MAG: 4-hydroxythreonine-4-phosphate dehydrogenase PdxA [Bacteroidia bacterium]|nr:4-hydroxythreonine-4-phosphate dehydrogenase PdxA [Bacteroidia bacterium]